MDNIVFHVGLHKTGTTFLQRNVFPKIKSITYVKGNLNIVKNKLKKLKSIEGKLLISQETFTNGMTKHTLFKDIKQLRERIAKQIKEQYPDAKIILVLRDKESWLRSMYSQFVKMGYMHSYNAFYLEIANEDAIDFNHLFELYRGLFDEVLILHFEQLKEDHRGFIEAITSFMGVTTPNYRNNKNNRSLTKTAINILMFMNRYIDTPANKEIGILPFCMHPLFWLRIMRRAKIFKILHKPNYIFYKERN